MLLEHGGSATVPFTVWVPEQASADVTHESIVEVVTRSGVMLAGTVLQSSVLATENLTVTVDRSARFASVGERVEHLFQLRNTGNRRGTIRIETGGVPDWPLRQPVSTLELAAGETREIAIEVAVPGSAGVGEIHLMTLTATIASRDADGDVPVQGTRQASIEVERPVAARRYRSLPLRASVSALGRYDQPVAYGLRLKSAGPVSETTSMALDLDLITETDEDAAENWRAQHVRLGLERRNLRATIGDLHTRYPEIAPRAQSSRGLMLEAAGPRWAARALGGKDRTTGARTDWSAGLRWHYGQNSWLGTDWVRRENRGSGDLADTERDMAVFTAQHSPAPGFIMALEGGFGRVKTGALGRSGVSGQFSLRRQGRRLATRGLVYAGSDGNPGWRGDRRGVVFYSQYRVADPIAVWGNVDASTGRALDSDVSPELAMLRYRLGGRVAPRRLPRFETFMTGELDREGPGGALRYTEKQVLDLSTWFPVGPILLGASQGWGRAANHLTLTDGDIRSHGLSLSGSFGRASAALRWDYLLEWLPESNAEFGSRITSGDLGWSPASGTMQFGVSATRETYTAETGGTPVGAQYTLRPRIDWRLFGAVGLHTEAGLRWLDGEGRVDHWRVNLTWASADVVPVLWSPIGGELCVVIFLDGNLDGLHNFGEPGMGGIGVDIDGDQHVSKGDGTVCIAALSPGDHTLDLNIASMPPGLVPRRSFPMTVWIEVDDRVEVFVPLTRSCSLSGEVFRDQDYDGVRGHAEAGLPDLRLELMSGDERTSECLTSATGRFRFAAIPPGSYVVRIADGWLPSGWVTTAGREMVEELRPGEEVALAPYGVAPKKLPIVRTYTWDTGTGTDDRLIPSVSMAPGRADRSATRPGDYYTLHVGSFQDPERARRLSSKLMSSFEQAVDVVPTDVLGELWNRIYLGRFSSEDEAQALAEELVASGAVDRAIVREIPRDEGSAFELSDARVPDGADAAPPMILPAAKLEGPTTAHTQPAEPGQAPASPPAAASTPREPATAVTTTHPSVTSPPPPSPIVVSAAEPIVRVPKEYPPSEPRAAPDEAYHTLQMASSRNAVFANLFGDRLRSSALHAVDVVPTKVRGGTWYRVYVGCFRSSGAARHVIDEAQETRLVGASGVIEAAVVYAGPVDALQDYVNGWPASSTAGATSDSETCTMPYYSLQVASFRDESRARVLEQRIESTLREGCDVVPSHVFGRRWNRIYVGRFPSAWMARELADGLKHALIVERRDAETGDRFGSGATSTFYSVQLASFRDTARARRFHSRMQSTVRQEIEMVTAQVSGATWHRILLGRYPTAAAARAAARRFGTPPSLEIPAVIRERSCAVTDPGAAPHRSRS